MCVHTVLIANNLKKLKGSKLDVESQEKFSVNLNHSCYYLYFVP